MFQKLSILITCLLFSGCSVFMAATGSDPVDFSVVRQGAHRSTVESQLGKPIKFLRNSSGDFAVYQVITNDKPDYRRAAANALLVGITLGIAEFATFPTEALQGDQNRIEIIYTPGGKVRSFQHIVNEAPLPNPSDYIEKKLETEQKQI